MKAQRQLKHLLVLLMALASQNAIAEIRISNAYILAGPPTATAHAAYLSINNHGNKEIVLCHAKSQQFGAIEIHRSVLSNETFSMEHLDTITIPPQSSAHLEPNGTHLMLFRTQAPLTRGEHIEMELVFENTDSISVRFPIRTPADM